MSESRIVHASYPSSPYPLDSFEFRDKAPPVPVRACDNSQPASVDIPRGLFKPPPAPFLVPEPKKVIPMSDDFELMVEQTGNQFAVVDLASRLAVSENSPTEEAALEWIAQGSSIAGQHKTSDGKLNVRTSSGRAFLVMRADLLEIWARDENGETFQLELGQELDYSATIFKTFFGEGSTDAQKLAFAAELADNL